MTTMGLIDNIKEDHITKHPGEVTNGWWIIQQYRTP